VAAAEPVSSNAPVASANLELDADSSCVTRADLVARVRARSPRVRFVDDGSGLIIRVKISTATSGAFAADVTLADPGAKSPTRHVLARTCNEAADAVSLIIAVTLDPNGADTHTDNGAPRPVGTAGSGNAATNEHDASAKAHPSPAKPAPPPTPLAPSDMSEPRTVSPRNPPSLTVSAQLAAEAFVGVAPGVMPGVTLYGMAGLERSSVWSPAAVLGLRHAWRSSIEEEGGSASFALDAATLDLCPLRFRRSMFEARSCGSLLVGRLTAHATDTLNPAAESKRPFWVLGGAAIVSAELPWLLEVTGRLAIGANLVRDSFEFSPSIFHEVPAVSGAASIGIGLRWR
jgi:hypothetical protein